MKPTHPLAISIALTCQCLAFTPVAERFNGDSLSGTRWHQVDELAGKWELGSGKLNFIVPTITPGRSRSTLELLSSYPGYNENWQITIDLRNKANKYTVCNLRIRNSADPSDSVFVSFFGKGGFYCGVSNNGSTGLHGTFDRDYNSTKCAVRLQFDKATHLFTLYVSPTTKGEGYQFAKVGTLSPAGNRNADGWTGNWGMDHDDRFAISIYGGSNDQALGSGKIVIDNFKLERPTPTPAPGSTNVLGL